MNKKLKLFIFIYLLFFNHIAQGWLLGQGCKSIVVILYFSLMTKSSTVCRTVDPVISGIL